MKPLLSIRMPAGFALGTPSMNFECKTEKSISILLFSPYSSVKVGINVPTKLVVRTYSICSFVINLIRASLIYSMPVKTPTLGGAGSVCERRILGTMFKKLSSRENWMRAS